MVTHQVLSNNSSLPNLFTEYSMFGYNICKDSSHCFVCALFLHRLGHSKSSWVVESVRQ